MELWTGFEAKDLQLRVRASTEWRLFYVSRAIGSRADLQSVQAAGTYV